MNYDIDKPYDCPFLKKDYDGFPDGCNYDGTKCFNDDVFPEDCPLKKSNITINKS